MKNIYNLPQTPTVSRFSPPWDADGWYYVGGKLDRNAAVHSNTAEYIKSFPEKYLGADIIVTYDSIAAGTDDHQECDFFAETDITLTVAYDIAAVERIDIPEWLEEYSVDSAEIATNVTNYVPYSKNFPAGSHIVIPGFKGNYHHYFLLIRPTAESAEGSMARIPVSTEPVRNYDGGRTYHCYISDGFNAGIPWDYRTTGKVGTVSYYGDDVRYKSVKLSGNASIKKDITLSSKVIARTVIIPTGDSGEYAFGAVTIKNGRAYCGDVNICRIKYGTEIAIEVKYDLDRMTACATINHVFGGIETKIYPCEIASFYCYSGEMLINNLYVADDTEIYVANENFAYLPEMKAGEGATVDLVPFPFQKNKSAKITGGAVSYDFPAVAGTLSIEAKVFAENDGCCAVFASDGEGYIAAGAAFYKNCVFRAENDEWENTLCPLTPYCYYPAGNFYEVRFVINTKKSTYDFWIDGACRAKNVRFCENVEKISKLSFSVGEGNVFYVNSIKIYDDESLARGILCGKPIDIRRCGAHGNGRDDDTAAFNRAIEEAAYTCRPVYVHDGVYLVGEINLAPDMTLFVDPSAVILGFQDHEKYPFRVPGQSLCANRQLGRGLIYGKKIRGVTITGGGMIDGNGKYRFKMNDPLPERRERDARPDIIYIAYSSDIRIENVNLRRSAFWTVVPLSCRNITIKNLRLNCMNTPNRDGIDPVDCQNIAIRDCNILAGDDGLCFKSSDIGGCANISVSNMMISSLASAVKFGTDTYYSLENAYFHDCFIKNVNRCGVSLESVDGALVRNVIFERFDITDASAPLYVVTGARNRMPRNVSEVRTSKIQNIVFKSFNFRSPRTHGHPLPIYESMVVGQSEEQCIENVSFDDFNIVSMGNVGSATNTPPETIDAKYPEYDRHGLSAGRVFTFRFCKNIQLKNIREEKILSPDERPIAAFFDCEGESITEDR